LIFIVPVRPNELFFSHHPQTCSAIYATPASMSAGSRRSFEKVVSNPDDLRRRFGTTGRSSLFHWRSRDTRGQTFQNAVAEKPVTAFACPLR